MKWITLLQRDALRTCGVFRQRIRSRNLRSVNCSQNWAAAFGSTVMTSLGNPTLFCLSSGWRFTFMAAFGTVIPARKTEFLRAILPTGCRSFNGINSEIVATTASFGA